MEKSVSKNHALCFLMEDFYPIINGSVTQILLLGELLAKHGMKITVITKMSSKDQLTSELINGIRVIRVKSGTNASRWNKYLMIIPAFIKLIKEMNTYDAIVVCDLKVLGTPGIMAAAIARKACFLRAESCGEMDGSFASMFDNEDSTIKTSLVKSLVWLRNRVLLNAKGFLSISSVIRNEYLKTGVPESKIIEITNGIDIEKYSPISDENQIKLKKKLNLTDKKYFIYSGRLTKGKGLEYLIRAWKKITTRFPEAHLILIGSGNGYSLDCEDELRIYCKENDITSTVTYTGNIDNVHEYLQIGSCFLLPSQTESLSLSLIEALSCELPCIATGVGGILDYAINNKNALLVPYGSETALFEAMKNILENEDKAKQLGREGRKTVKDKYNIQTISKQYMALTESAN